MHPFLVFSFPLNQNFAIVSVLLSSYFIFLYFKKKKEKKERVIHFLLPSSYIASYLLKKKKKKRLGIHFTSFASLHFLNLLSLNSFRASFCDLILSVTLAPFLQKKKKKKNQYTFPTFHFEGLFTLVSQGCRKREKHLANLWHEGERYFI